MMSSLPQMFLSSTSTPQQSHDAMVTIKNHYQEITDIVANSESVFQKLYTKKQSLLADFLEESLERMTNQLVVYNDLTKSQNIERLCEQRRKQLQAQRMTLLKQFLKVSENNFVKKNKNTKLGEEIKEMMDELGRMQQINNYLIGQNTTLKPHLQKISQRHSEVLFPTQPIPYVSPYSAQNYHPSRKSQSTKIKRKNYRNVRYTPFVEKLSELKSFDNESEITENVLNLPEVRQLMMRVLQRKK